MVEKGNKTVEKRKRKRKADDSGEKAVNGKQTARTPSECKKINDYFVKNTGSSPVRHGAKPSSPAHPAPLSLVSICCNFLR